MINVTKAFLPDINEYIRYLQGVWDRVHLTNHGPLVNELEERLKEYLGVKHFFFVNNGTIALQIAIKALDLRGTIITTPFSYVATTSAIVWENATPIFVDVESSTFTIDPAKIEAAIRPDTTGILATHVYGIPSNLEEIERIALKHKLKVIYDAAHAFGVKHKDRSVLTYGDISTLSFHATKLFHTVEGGGIVTDDDVVAHRISYMRNFGHKGQEDFWGLGINGKSSEFHAAMGLCVLPHMNQILARRQELSELYSTTLANLKLELQRPVVPKGTHYNYSYYPILLASEKDLLAVRDSLNAAYIYPRRYFYPSLHKLPYIQDQPELPVSESLSKRVLCLPLYHDLPNEEVKRICAIIAGVLKF